MEDRANGSTRALLVRLVGVMKRLMPFIAVAVLFAVLGFLTTVSIPSLLVFLMFKAIEGEVPSLFTLLTLILFALLRGGFRYGEHYFGHYVAFHSLADLRKMVFAKLRALTPAKLDGRDSGALLKMISEDIEALEIFFAHTLAPVCTGLIAACLMGSYFASFSLGLSVLALATYLLLAVIIPWRFARSLEGVLSQQSRGRKEYISYFLDSLKAMKDLQQFSKEEERFAYLNTKSQEVNDLESAVAQMQFLQQSATFTSLGIAILLVFGYLFSAVLQGVLSLERASIALVGFMSSFAPFLELGRLPLGFKRAMNAARHLFALMDESEPLASGDARPISSESIRFQDLSFAYDQRDVPIFSHFSSQFQGDQIIGLVGESGSGKSSLMKLLMRWYDQQEGQILLTETDNREFDRAYLQGHFAYVPQVAQLFHKSVRENLLLSREGIDDEQIWELARKCRLEKRLRSLPYGLDTIIDGSSDFSAGERQRLELMRALLKGAEVYIFDEPTSHLDSLNEAAFLSIVKEECQGMVFLISHRASSLAFVDQLYQLENATLRRIK